MKTRIILGLVVALLLGVLLSSDRSPVSIGGVSDADTCLATSTSASFTNRRGMIKVGPTILCGLTITAANNVVMTIKNATSSTDVSSTTVAVIAGNTISGEYFSGIQLDRGLFVDTVGTWGAGYTISYR